MPPVWGRLPNFPYPVQRQSAVDRDAGPWN